MSKGLTGIIAVVVIIVLFAGLYFGTYNGLVEKQENVTNAAADIDTVLQRRADLIPNLVSCVKGYMEHENEVIDAITTARENLIGAGNTAEKLEANDELTSALNNLLVVVENYPDLKSSENFVNLQDELAGTENRIATARRDYNNAVKIYNTAIKRFPAKIIADMSGFEAESYFEASDSAQEVPNVNFN